MTTAPDGTERADGSLRLESAEVGVERPAVLGGMLSLLWSIGLLALVLLAVLRVVVVPLWICMLLLVAPIPIALARRLLRRVSLRRTSGVVGIDAGRVAIERAGARRELEFPPVREGWATELADGTAVVALRVGGGRLVCFRVDTEQARKALSAARVTPERRPLVFSLERPGPWSAWLRWLTIRRWARVGLVTMLLALAALELDPPLYPLAYLFGLALFVGERALLVRDPARVVVEEATLVLAAAGFRRRVSLDHVVSVDATPRGVVLTSADGGELVLPLAAGRPEQRDNAGFWTSEADLRDAQLARQTALIQSLKLACAALGTGKDGYRDAALRGYARAARVPAGKS